VITAHKLGPHSFAKGCSSFSLISASQKHKKKHLPTQLDSPPQHTPNSMASTEQQQDEVQAPVRLEPFLSTDATTHTTCVVTGASRGFGQAVAIAAVHQYTTESAGKNDTHLRLVLVGRTEEGLRATAALCEACGCSDVRVVRADLGCMDTLDATVQSLLSAALGSPRGPASGDQDNEVCVRRVLLVNNAATLGPLRSMSTHRLRTAEVRSYMDLNVTSCAVLSSGFACECAQRRLPLAVVNVSSLAAVQPFQCMGMYCVGKAARAMMHSVLTTDPAEMTVRTINFGPGIMKTGMQEQIRDSGDVAAHSAGQFLVDVVWKKDKAIPTEVSAEVLFRVLVGGE
jgi:sepiapterin reductase